MVAILNLVVPREHVGGAMAVVSRLLYVVSRLLYLVVPVIIVRRLVLRRTVDTQTVLGAIAAEGCGLRGMAQAAEFFVGSTQADQAWVE